jgi:INO80 complex subunit C
MPSTPAPQDDSHQILLDQMDIYYVAKPFRNNSWKPSGRRNKNTKQIIGEASRREASVLGTQNNSGASTPVPATGTTTDGTMTPVQGAERSRPVDMGKAAQSLSTLVLERNMQKASGSLSHGSLTVPGALASTALSSGPAVTYTNIESAPSLHPAHQKQYCDITGLPSRYTDPKTKLRYVDREIFGVVRTLPPGGPDQYLAARGANVVLK